MKEQPARDENIRAIVAYFESGVKERAEMIGIELEHTLVHADGTPVSYLDEDGQRIILERLRETYPISERDATGNITLLSDGVANITLEPAAQVEVSAGPFSSLHDALARIRAFQCDLDRASARDINVTTLGYHPTRRAIDLKLIPKARYRIMNEYLGAVSSFGICMMRGSASTQISIDYTSVDDCLRKLRLANAIVPIVSLICDNSPVFEAAPRTHQLVRTEIWEKCDPDRCCTPPGVMDAGFDLRAYAEYILDAPAMVDISTGSPELSERTIGSIYADRKMSEADIEHVLSVFFTDVRLKRYIEIRPADALPARFAVAYAALIKGLFYAGASLDAMDRIFQGVSEDDIVNAKAALMEQGYAAQVYAHPVSEIADELMSLAAAGLPDDEVDLLKPLAVLVANRVTLADMETVRAGSVEDDA